MFAGIFLAAANFAYALEAKYPKIMGLSIDNNSKLPEYAKYFFNIGMAVAGALAVLVIVFGGIYYLVSFGRGKFVNEGKEWIKAGILGLLLIVCSYLMAYTINPYLVVFDLKELAPLTFLANYFNPPGPQPPVQIYSEIPIGILTENLLARQIDCYDFTADGDPIPGEKITTDDRRLFSGPTYLEHDRVDCILKLAQAAEKKAQIAKNLSDKIAELMLQKCKCQESTCDPKCDKDKGCVVSESSCVGPCKNGECKPITNISCCSEHSGIFDPKTKKELTTRQAIENGPIIMALSNGLNKDYLGLDEFRSKFSQNYSLIKNIVEVQPPAKLNEKEITIINLGNCAACNYVCKECDPNDKNYSACIKEQKKCKNDAETCEKNLQKCLKDTSPWYSLTIIDQLIYFQGKIEEIKEKVKEDSDNLKRAESYLGQCYIADTYVDFLKTFEDTNKKDKVIMIDKPFYESPSKYCKGFEYNNSTCYSQCKDICPGTDKTDFDCYKNASTFEDVKNCYDYRSCINGSPFNNFQICMTSCKDQCLGKCEKYSGDDKKECLKKCGNDSQCLIDNEDKCLVDFKQLKECADDYDCRFQCGSQECIDSCVAERNDPGFVKNCIENSAYKCTYCSDQYAGYPSCLKSTYSLQGEYSSSFIYQHPDYQICSSAYEPITIDNEDGTKVVIPCLRLYPETAKCPASSKCPECPCDIVDETIDYFNPQINQPGTSCSTSGGSSGGGGDTCQTTDPSAPWYCAGGGSCVNGTCVPPGTSAGSASGTSASGSSVAETKNINEYKICSGNCDDSYYNDDPLTFYCQQSWWDKEETKNTIPIGHDRICPKEKEIPVGQTIDEAEKWADDLINNIDKVTKKIKDMIQYMERIVEQKDYCNCDSKCEDGNHICHTDCNEGTQEMTGSDGSVTIETTCSFVPCKGNPCQLMIDLLLGADCKDACGKGKGMDYYRNEIDSGVKDFIIFTIEQNRSDIVKELEYSRQKTNECSVVQNNYGTQTRILSCTRVQDEIISPIKDKNNETIMGDKSYAYYCYGKALGEILKTKEPTADNWFCCEDRKKEE